MGFGLDLKRFADKTNVDANTIVKSIAVQVLLKLQFRSPVGDMAYWADYWKEKVGPGYVGGRFRGNWFVGRDAINDTTTEETELPDALARVNEAGPQFAGHVINITNSLPYALRIEDGWSQRQAPHGVVGLTVIEFEPIVKAAAAAAKVL